MITVNIPEMGPNCKECRFRTYGEFLRAGDNVLYCELFEKSLKDSQPLEECPTSNYEVNNNDE